MSCKLKHETAFLNSRQFLIDQGAIDKLNSIKSLTKFNQANTQLSKDAFNAYGVEGTLWNEKSNRAVPNHTVLKQIDNKRKELGIYDSKEAGQVKPDSVTTDSIDFVFNEHPELSNISESLQIEDYSEPILETITDDYTMADSNQERKLVQELNESQGFADMSIEEFNSIFPHLSYLTDYEKQVVIASIKEGDIVIQCGL